MGECKNYDDVTAWALAAGAGDAVALDSFVRATRRDVWRLVARLADPRRADDLTQETYLRALAGLPGFAGRSSATTWLLSIARRVIVDDVRSAMVRPRTAPDADWVRASDAAVARDRPASGFEDMVELSLLVDRLADEKREALVLSQVLGMSYADIADACGCPIGTVRSRVARARAELQDALAPAAS